jgi:hypothetical protein
MLPIESIDYLLGEWSKFEPEACFKSKDGSYDISFRGDCFKVVVGAISTIDWGLILIALIQACNQRGLTILFDRHIASKQVGFASLYRGNELLSLSRNFEEPGLAALDAYASYLFFINKNPMYDPNANKEKQLPA